VTHVTRRAALHSPFPRADIANVDLGPMLCPYDGAPLDVEISAAGLLQLVCGACEAVWETHGSHVGRVREPDRQKLIAARQYSGSPLSDERASYRAAPRR
jgi:hypothetical protein